MASDLESLLAEYIERLEDGEKLTPEDFCNEHPDRSDELLAALSRLEKVDDLFPQELQTPGVMGPYEILEPIGRGGLGMVLRARDRRAAAGEDIVAVKLLNPMALLNPRARERFRREGEALSRISHRNIVGIREVGFHNEQPYLVMDLVDGRSLAEIVTEARLRSEGLPNAWDALDLPGEGSGAQRAARLVARLARAIAALHAEGILHRDLKPHNVIVTDAGEPVVIDFGLAVDESFETLTVTGDVVGTLAYMSPEQARGERVTEPTDIYGVGAILHELLTLEPPHGGAGSGSLLRAVTQRGAGRIERIDPAVPRPLAVVVYRCLAFAPRRRYGNAAAVADDLEAFAAGEPVAGPAPGVWERAGDALRRHKQQVAGVAALIVVSAVVVTSIVLVQGQARREREFQSARQDAAVAWLDRKDEVLSEHVETLSTLKPEDPVTTFFGILAAGDGDSSALAPGWRELYEGINDRLNDPSAAMASVDKAYRLLPESALPPAVLGRAARTAEDLPLAIRELSVAIGRAPRSGRLRFELGRALYESGDVEGAIEPSTRATELDAENPFYWTQLARVCYYTKRYAEGLSAARMAAKNSSESETEVLRSLGVLLTSNGKHEEALAVFHELYRLDPRSRNTCFSLGLVYDTLDDHLQAMRYYQEAIDAFENESQGRLHLANIYAGANRAGCEKCLDFFTANPKYLDPDRAEGLCLEALEIDGGRDMRALLTIISVLAKIDRLRDLIPRLEAERDAATDDKRVANLQRAIRRAKSVLPD